MKSIAMVLGAAFCSLTFSCGGVAPGSEGTGETESAGAEKGEGAAEAVANEATAEPGAPRAHTVDGLEETADEGRVDEEAPPIALYLPAENCTGVAGTWVGQIYSDRHDGFYEFTLKILQTRDDASALTGSILAHSWQGSRNASIAPTSCEGGYHWTVAEVADGRLGAEGTVSFASTSWSVGEHFCGERVTDYSLDRIDAVLPSGDPSLATTMSGKASDDVVWTDGKPIELTRIACE